MAIRATTTDERPIRSELTVGMLRRALAGRPDDELVTPIARINSGDVDMEDDAPLLALLGVEVHAGRLGIVVEQSYFDDDAVWRDEENDHDE